MPNMKSLTLNVVAKIRDENRQTNKQTEDKKKKKKKNSICPRSFDPGHKNVILY